MPSYKRNKGKRNVKEKGKKRKKERENVELRQIGTPSSRKGAINVIGAIPDYLIIIR